MLACMSSHRQGLTPLTVYLFPVAGKISKYAAAGRDSMQTEI